MNVREILTELARRQITLRAERDVLKIRAVPGALTEDLRRELAARKPEILAFLQKAEARPDEDQITPVPRGGPMLLSVPQQWMWYWDQVDPANAFLHLPFATRLRGRLDREALDAAFTDVLRRHETLRSTFHSEDAGPRAHIHAPTAVQIPLSDLSHLAAAEQPHEAQRLLSGFLTRSFDVGRGPLFRLLLLRFSDEEHWFAGVLHHLIADMGSTFLVQQEVFKLYDARRSGKPAALPELPVQYADYAAWQHRVFVGELREQKLRFWREKLADAPPVVLPADRPRPKRPSRRGNTALVELPEPLARAADAFCRAHRVSPFTFAVSALAATLHLCSGQSDLLLGCSINGRSHAALAPLLGNLGWDLGLRTDLSGEPTFAELVQRVGRVVTEALEHQDLPVAEAFRALRQDAHETFDPFFKVMITALVQPDGIPVSGLAVEPLALWLPRGTLYYDLFVAWVAIGDRCYLSFDYAEDLFERATIELLAQTMIRTIAAGVASPGVLLSALPREEALQSNARAFAAPPLTVTVTATFTAEPLAAGLEFWSDELGWPWQVQFTGFGQVFQQLLNAGSELSRNRDGVNVVLVRLSDLAPVAEPGELDRATQQLIAAASAARAPVVLVLCQSPGGAFAERESAIAAALRSAPGVHVTTSAELAALYPLDDVHDPAADAEGRIPYTPAAYAVLATWVARRAYALKSRPRKVIVVDCDNTLWEGVCAETGPDGVEIGDGHHALQAFLLEQHDQGTLLCLCSKNEEPDVHAVFESGPAMPLRREHLAATRINWQPKSQNLRALARELNVGLDSFVFIDDNPLECAEVRAGCPEVLVVPVSPSAAGMAELLAHLWPLDRLVVTEEDRQRTQFYQREADRVRLRAEAPSFAAFLERLELKIQVAEMLESQIARVAQLTQRTNQFNTTTLRLSETEIAARGSARCLVTAVQDRLGDHGLVGVTLLCEDLDALRVEGLLQSCRTLGRGVEHQMLREVAQRAAAASRSFVDVPLHATARNRPVRDFLAGLSQTLAGSQELAGGGYRFATGALTALRFDPQQADEPEVESEERGRPQRARGPEVDPERLVRIARTLIRADALAAAMSHRRKPATRLARPPYVAPRSDTERALAEIWSALLGVPEIGTTEDFFALGGDSVIAIQMIGRARAAGLGLAANDLLTHKSIAGLATLVTSSPEAT